MAKSIGSMVLTLAVGLTLSGCLATETLVVGGNGVSVSKPVLKVKLAPQSVPENKNAPPDMTSDAKHFLLAANDDVRIDIQSFDFTITDNTHPGTPPAQCSPYPHGSQPGGVLPCDGWLATSFFAGLHFKIRVYACPNGTACPEDPAANAPNLILETDALAVGGNPVVASPTHPVFKVKEDAVYQIKPVFVFIDGETEGDPADTAEISVVTPGMTRAFPAATGMLAGPGLASLAFSGKDPAGNNSFTFIESPALGDNLVGFSENLTATSVQVLDQTGTPIPFCAVRIAIRDRCGTTAPDLTSADLSTCPELTRHAMLTLTPAHENPASDLTPIEWIALFSTPNGLPDINCHPNVPDQAAQISLSFQLKVK